jgi:hypothetical protein
LQFAHAAYKEMASDIVVEKSDTTVETMSENKVDKLYWESQRSWHKGAGQRRFDEPNASDPNAFLLSQGLDMRIPGQATLVPGIINQHSAAAPWLNNTSSAPRLAVAADIVFQEDSTATGGQNDSFRGVTLPTSDSGSPTLKTVRAGSVNTNGVYDVCTDGQTLFFAIPSDATPKITSLDATAAGGSVGSVYASGTFGTGPTATYAYVIAWVKQQLVAAGLQAAGSGSATAVWRLFTVGAGAGGTSTELLLLPPGYTVKRNCICEIAGFVLFGASSFRQSVVYAWDGFTTPYVVAELPDGDVITSMSSYLGVEVLIGCQRVKSAGSVVGTGVLYVAQATAAAQLILQEIVEIGDSGVPWPVATTSDGNDYSITAIAARGGYSYFSWQPFGLGVYDHANQSYSRYLGNIAANAGSLLNGGNPPAAFATIGDIAVCQRRLCFSAQQTAPVNPLWVENISKLVASGQVLGSTMDWNIDKAKSVNQAEIGTLPLPVGTSATLAYSTDGGSTSTTVGTLSATGGTAFTSSATSSPPANFFVTSNAINYVVTLNSEPTTQLLTPTLKKAGFGAWYGSKPTIEWTIYIMADDRMTTKAGTPYILTGSGAGVVGPDPRLGDRIAQKFRDLRSTQAIVDWQPPGWGDTRTDSYKVQVRGYTYYRWNEPGVGPGGAAIEVVLKQAP